LPYNLSIIGLSVALFICTMWQSVPLFGLETAPLQFNSYDSPSRFQAFVI